jgi:hypothetical protein
MSLGSETTRCQVGGGADLEGDLSVPDPGRHQAQLDDRGGAETPVQVIVEEHRGKGHAGTLVIPPIIDRRLWHD